MIPAFLNAYTSMGGGSLSIFPTLADEMMFFISQLWCKGTIKKTLCFTRLSLGGQVTNLPYQRFLFYKNEVM